MQMLKVEVKDRILLEAQRIFLKLGYDKTTMREIADKCEISVGNIYRYFKNKDSILDELIGDFSKDLKAFSDSVDITIFKDASHKMCTMYIDGMIDVFKNNQLAVGLLAQNHSNKKLLQFENIIINGITDRIMHVAKNKKTKCTLTVAKAIASASVEGIKVIISDRKGKSNKDIENDLRTYLNFVLKDLQFRLKEI